MGGGFCFYILRELGVGRSLPPVYSSSAKSGLSVQNSPECFGAPDTTGQLFVHSNKRAICTIKMPWYDHLTFAVSGYETCSQTEPFQFFLLGALTLLFFFQFSFFLLSKLCLFLVFSFAFISFSTITHICSPFSRL